MSEERGALSLQNEDPTPQDGWENTNVDARGKLMKDSSGGLTRLLLSYVTGSSEARVEVSGRPLRLVCDNAQGGSLRGTWEGYWDPWGGH